MLQNAMFATLRIICGYTRQSERTEFNLDGISHSNVPGAFEVCLELSSNSKDQVSLVAGEFCELVHTTEIATFVTLFVTRSPRKTNLVL